MEKKPDQQNPILQVLLLAICLIMGLQTCSESESEQTPPSIEKQSVPQNP